MPLYEYECDSCGHRFEVIQKFSDPPVESCPTCGSRVRKLVASPAFQFKGSGWYITDYGKKDSGGEKKGGGAGSDAKSEAATSTTTDSASKPAAASDSGSKPATPAAPAKTD